ncbi:MAG: helix-turn-helix transcriptional regulator [Planctomycetales bacterium]|nr:helix-turn-helix transcriptional regulator [Planctomycetales bacterium]
MSEKVENRNRAVLEAAIALAQERGFANVTRDLVAERAQVAAGSVNNAYGNMEALRDAVMAVAVERELVDIVGQGLAAGHPAARNAPEELKRDALAKLAA